MSGFLLDTNVVSELRKKDRGAPAVRHWIESASDQDLHLSVLVMGELRHGVELIRRRDPIAAERLDVWVSQLREHFADRILPVTEGVAEIWGRLGLERPIPPVDALLAATAIQHDLTLVTRNITDYQGVRVPVLNPFVLQGRPRSSPSGSDCGPLASWRQAANGVQAEVDQ